MFRSIDLWQLKPLFRRGGFGDAVKRDAVHLRELAEQEKAAILIHQILKVGSRLLHGERSPHFCRDSGALL